MSQQTPSNIQGLILSQKLSVIRLNDAGLPGEEICSTPNITLGQRVLQGGYLFLYFNLLQVILSNCIILFTYVS